MTSKYHCNVGLAHRARIRAIVLPRLCIGTRLPPTALLGRWLGLSQRQAWRHLRRVLVEAEVRTEKRGRPPRLWVVAMPERRAAA